MKEINITIPEDFPLEKLLTELEKIVIQRVLIHNRYNQSKTARDLGMSRSSLFTKIKQYGI